VTPLRAREVLVELEQDPEGSLGRPEEEGEEDKGGRRVTNRRPKAPHTRLVQTGGCRRALGPSAPGLDPPRCLVNLQVDVVEGHRRASYEGRQDN